MRIGIVGSSGGSIFEEMRGILDAAWPDKVEYLVVTDRECGLETICAQNGICCRRIAEMDNIRFSETAARFFAEHGGVDFVLLFYLRLVTEELFQAYPTFNVHPSLLPAFAGFNPVRKARRQRVRFLGATLHLVDASADTGAIIAQACMPILPGDMEERLNKYSFVQKVGLSLLAVEMMAAQAMTFHPQYADVEVAAWEGSDRCNPYLRDPALRAGLAQLQEREKVRAFA